MTGAPLSARWLSRAALRARRPAMVSGVAAAAAGVAMSIWASIELTATTSRGSRRPLRVTRVELEDGEGRIHLDGPLADLPGRWGLDLADGYAVIGPPDADGERSVQIRYGTINPGDRGRLDAHTYHPDHLPEHLRPRVVTINGPEGDCPAWRFDFLDHGVTSSDWAIFVHGRGAQLTQALRIVPTLRGMGYTTLVPSYRGDEGAPPAALSGLGSHEWCDLEAAVSFAQQQGARRIVLVGYSMGASLITAFLRSSDLAPSVAGVVLDSPVLDWGAVLRHVARSRRLPGLLVPATMAACELRARIDWQLLNALDSTQAHSLPCLLFHGTGDDIVPVAVSDALAKARPDQVIYHRIEHAPHVASYNVDSVRYERALSEFLATLPPATDEPVCKETTRVRSAGPNMIDAPITQAVTID